MSLCCQSSITRTFLALFLYASYVSSWTTSRPPSTRIENSRLFMNQNSPSERHDVMLNFMEQAVDNLVGDGSSTVDDDEDPELVPLVECIAKAADGRKADNIVILRVREISTLTSYLVFLSGNSRPQNQAIAAAVSDEVEEAFQMRTQGSGVPEGTADSGWMLLDYGSVMVHIMTPRSRLFYDVEGQWREKGGVDVDMSHVLLPNNAIEAEATLGGTMNVPEEEDPFWS